MSEPKKKESPNPLPRALDNGVSVRPLAPMRRLGVPLGIAAALALTTGGAAAYAMSRSKAPEVDRDPVHTTSSHHGSSSSIDVDDIFARVKNFLTPEPERPKLAGDVAVSNPPPVASASSIAPNPNPPMTAGGPAPIAPPVPDHEPTRLGGKVAAPTPPAPVAPTPVPVAPHPQPVRIAK